MCDVCVGKGRTQKTLHVQHMNYVWSNFDHHTYTFQTHKNSNFIEGFKAKPENGVISGETTHRGSLSDEHKSANQVGDYSLTEQFKRRRDRKTNSPVCGGQMSECLPGECLHTKMVAKMGIECVWHPARVCVCD